MYYKLIDAQTIIGVASIDDFRRYQKKHHIVIYSDIDKAQLVQYHDKYYRDNWLKPLDADCDVEYQTVSIVRIEQDEYESLAEALETNEEIQIEEIIEEPVEEVPPVDENEQTTVEFLKEFKINQMSKCCHDTITNGVDVVLSDGKSHHFSLEVEDQLKIQALALKAQNGEQSLPWHEDDNYCVFYSAEDIMRLYQAMEESQLFHTTYFNSLKMYIKSLTTLDEINAVTYGMEIPVEYQSEVLQYLLSQQRGEV